MILKIVKQTVSDLYKINLLRFLIVFFRFIFFFYILRRKKLLYDEKEDINNLVTFLENESALDMQFLWKMGEDLLWATKK